MDKQTVGKKSEKTLPPLRRIRLTVAYDGTNYCGWQVQPNGVSIQSTLQAAIEDLVGEKINLTGASRTDSGVHALGQIAVFDTHMGMPADRFAMAINQRLPKDIVIQESAQVPLDFHPRYQKISKTYEYKILNRQKPLPCERLYSYFVPQRLDLDAMRLACTYLVGTHDFKNFCSTKTSVTDTVRTIYNMELKKDGDMLTLSVTGNGFLYNMVRIIVGALLKVGFGQRRPEELKMILESDTRIIPGPTAPAHGLTLMETRYEQPDDDLTYCTLCPRQCHADRTVGGNGFCKMDHRLKVARAALHMWEEPCISGQRGSGTVFFSGCTLRCIYCQNYRIAAGNVGQTITVETLAQMFLSLQAQGAANINLVTPTHYRPQIIKALRLAKKEGLGLPIVYNTSGYETVAAIEALKDDVDIFLTDFKYMDTELAQKYSAAPDYVSVVKTALKQMVSQTGAPKFNADDGMMTKGVIVRHLMLPGQLMDSKRIVKYLYETYGDQIYLSLMNQYTPLEQVREIPELNCRVKHKSYKKLIDYAIDLGVTNAYIQEGETSSESFIPQFYGEGEMDEV